MADQDNDKSFNGGKFPNRAPNRERGMAIEEFVDEAAVNRPDPEEEKGTEATNAVPRSKFRAFGADGERSKIGAAMETALANPLLFVAAAAAIPLLAVFWGLSRRRKNKADEDYDIGL